MKTSPKTMIGRARESDRAGGGATLKIYIIFLYEVRLFFFVGNPEKKKTEISGKKVLKWMFWIETNSISEFHWLFLNCELSFRRSESRHKTDAIRFLGPELVGPRFDPSEMFTSLPRSKNQPLHQAIARLGQTETRP